MDDILKTIGEFFPEHVEAVADQFALLEAERILAQWMRDREYAQNLRRNEQEHTA